MDVGQGFSLFGIPAFDDHFFVEIQYLREIALAEVWVVAGEGLLLPDQDEIFGEINCSTGRKGGDGCHDY